MPLLGIIVGLLFIVIPCIQTVALLGLSLAFIRGWRAFAWTYAARLIERLQPWGMADVFIVATLVSLLKILSVAEVEYGVSFWAFIAFALLLSGAYANVDTRRAIAELCGDSDEG